VGTDLAARLLEASELHGDFVLSSGRRSSVYFDKFRFLADPSLLREVAAAVRDLLPEGTTHLAAPEGAAMLLVAAVSLDTGLPVAVVRKETKPYGLETQVEGFAPAGARVALLEDVSTTGRQVAAAADALAARGAEVVAIVLALDRGGGGELRARGHDVRAVAVSDPDASR
jgi:orotate phosphoribosyltransferase